MKSIILLLAFVCLLATCTNAYNTVYSTKTSSGLQLTKESYPQGLCYTFDNMLHDAMPRSSSENTAAFQAYSGAGFSSEAPLGGTAEQAVCFTSLCSWIWQEGMYYGNTSTFMTGTYNGTFQAAAVPGVYNNFRSVYPVGWNFSYWGPRIPVMTSSGDWINDMNSKFYTQLVCEGYQFVRADAALGYPTYPNGDVIDPRSYVRISQRSHCGHKLQLDSSSRWIDVQCTKPFPWWAGLIIAVVCFVIVVVVIIIIMCCCLCRENKHEKHVHERQMDEDEDNIARVPTQSQIGMSRDTTLNANTGSYRSGEEDEDYDSRE